MPPVPPVPPGSYVYDSVPNRLIYISRGHQVKGVPKSDSSKLKKLMHALRHSSATFLVSCDGAKSKASFFC